MDNYAHLVEFEEENRRLSIFRVSASGKKSLYTYIDFSDQNSGQGDKTYDEVAKLLGENLLLDSPIARKIFRL